MMSDFSSAKFWIGGNKGFEYVFNSIYNDVKLHYPIEVPLTSRINIVDHNNPCPHPGGRCGISSMKITNKENGKTTVLTFWDRAMDIMNSRGLGWEDMNVVHVIGGLGVFMPPEDIQNILGTPKLHLLFCNNHR